MINNLILSVILGIVFVGTLYPLFVEAVSGEKLSVGAPYFNAVAGPLALDSGGAGRRRPAARAGGASVGPC